MLPLPPETVPQLAVDLFVPLYEAAVRYHGYEVRGFQHVPETGPAIIAFTHSLATYDIALFGTKIFLEKKRLIASLADRAIFRTPLLRQAAERLGAVEGEPEMARRILKEGRLLGVAPGGMREALRPSEKRYQLEWGNRTGFAKLAIDAQVPVILAACPAADDVFEVIDNPVTRFVYERFRMPLPLAVGNGFLPRKAKLIHMVSEPMIPPRDGDAAAFQRALTDRMNALINEALRAGETSK